MDWRIGRLIRSRTTNAVANANGVVSLAANQQRVGLTVWGNANADLFIIDPSQSLSVLAIAAAGTQENPINITLATHGDLPMQAMNILNQSAASRPVVYTEYFAPEKMLTLGLEQVMHQYPL